jgi:aryl-alcohol dehydrogenase-like predicted oxidoreductase
MNRREALHAIAAIAAVPMASGAAGGEAPASQQTTGEASTGMIYRELGKTGEKVSAIGLGGFHLGKPKDPEEAIRIVRRAVDRGVTFMDNCWDYNDGESERRMGLALKDGYRKRVFLMTKFDGRTKQSAARQIDESLTRLQTDTIDLIQYHENIRMDDGDRFFADDGPVEAVADAKKAGKIRYVGFTGHKDPAVHVRMLDVAAEHGYHFDTCQMPLNVMDAHFRSFEHHVVPRLIKEGVAILGMKPMGDNFIVQSGFVTPMECLHYALSLPTSVVITGCESVERLDQALEAVRTFRPLTKDQVNAILAKTAKAAMTGRYELFKTTDHFDGTAKHPEWMA